MEYVDGESLKSITDRLGKSNEKIPLNLSLFIVMEAARALQFAHGLNVIHRDVSPSNILISREGRVKLTDFGIAKAEHCVSGSTRVGILRGKPNYLSPEQARGEKIDRRADIFALGVIMFELISGRTLFTGENELEVLEKVKNARAEDILSSFPDVPAGLEEIIKKCLRGGREERYGDVSSFIADTENVIRSSGLSGNEEGMSAYLVGLLEKKNENRIEQEGMSDREIIYQTKIMGKANTVEMKTGRLKDLRLLLVCGIAAVFIFLFIRPDKPGNYLKTGQNEKIGRAVAAAKTTETKNLNQGIKIPVKTVMTKLPANNSILPKTPAPEVSAIGNKEAASGTIFINTQPSNALIYVDNVFQGEGNRVLRNLAAGDHIIKITHPDYEDEVRLVKVTSEKQKVRLLYRNGEIQVQD
jgi:hypothetical protein